MRRVALFIGSVLLIACTERKQSESISIEDFLPQSKRDTMKVEEDIAEDTLPPSPLIDFLTEVDSTFFLLDVEEENHFPDRLGYTEKEYLSFSSGKTAYSLVIWEFTDSLKTVSAFYNWLDCFGENCESIRVGEETSISKSKSLAVWVSTEKIVYINAKKKSIQYHQWKKWISTFFEDEWIFHFYKPVWNTINWYIPEKESVDEL